MRQPRLLADTHHSQTSPSPVLSFIGGDECKCNKRSLTRKKRGNSRSQGLELEENSQHILRNACCFIHLLLNRIPYCTQSEPTSFDRPCAFTTAFMPMLRQQIQLQTNTWPRVICTGLAVSYTTEASGPASFVLRVLAVASARQLGKVGLLTQWQTSWLTAPPCGSTGCCCAITGHSVVSR